MSYDIIIVIIIILYYIIYYQLNARRKFIFRTELESQCTIKRPVDANLKTKVQIIGNTNIDYFKQPIHFLHNKIYILQAIKSTIANKNDNFNYIHSIQFCALIYFSEIVTFTYRRVVIFHRRL